MGTFRRSRSPGALSLIPALMDSFRKLNTRYRTPGVGEGGRGGGGGEGSTRSYNGRYRETPPERGTLSGLRYIQR